MNRREFLKGGLYGVFGALLTWAGVVKAEEPEPGHDGSAGMLVSEWVYGPPIPPMLSKEEKREAFEIAVISEAKMAMGLMSEGELFTSEQAFDAIIESINKWNERVVLWDYGYEPDLWTGQCWGVKMHDHALSPREILEAYEQGTHVHVECPFPPDKKCSGCSSNGICWSEDENDQVSDNVSWDYSADTGGAPKPSYNHSPLRIRRTDDSQSIRGGVFRDEGAGFGHWIIWDIDGSDEDGNGAMDDPVATEACARELAKGVAA